MWHCFVLQYLFCKCCEDSSFPCALSSFTLLVWMFCPAKPQTGYGFFQVFLLTLNDLCLPEQEENLLGKPFWLATNRAQLHFQHQLIILRNVFFNHLKTLVLTGLAESFCEGLQWGLKNQASSVELVITSSNTDTN